MTTEEIVTDKQLDQAWGNANFGETPKREIIRYTLLKTCCEYGSGKFPKAIVHELGLTTKLHRLTRKGMDYLYEAFRNGSNV